MWLYQPIPLIQEEAAAGGPTTHAGVVILVGAGSTRSVLVGNLTSKVSSIGDFRTSLINRLTISGISQINTESIILLNATKIITSSIIISNDARLITNNRLIISAQEILHSDSRLIGNDRLIISGQQILIGQSLTSEIGRITIGGVISFLDAGITLVNGTISAGQVEDLQSHIDGLFESFIIGIQNF